MTHTCSDCVEYIKMLTQVTCLKDLKEENEKHGSIIMKGRQKYMERGQTVVYISPSEVTLSA